MNSFTYWPTRISTDSRIAFRTFFSGIPYQWQTGTSPARYEAWYAGMLYSCFQTIGLDLRVEDVSAGDRADMVVLHSGQVFVFGFKLAGWKGDGDSTLRLVLEQIRKTVTMKCTGPSASPFIW